SDWLEGVEGHEWMLKHNFISSADAVPNEKGFFPSPEGISQRPLPRLGPDGHFSAALTLAPAARPPGVISKSDDAAYETAVKYLCASLGELDNPNIVAAHPTWTRGSRKFVYRTMSSRGRSVEFREF